MTVDAHSRLVQESLESFLSVDTDAAGVRLVFAMAYGFQLGEELEASCLSTGNRLRNEELPEPSNPVLSG
jgi:hypothetical protein